MKTLKASQMVSGRVFLEFVMPLLFASCQGTQIVADATLDSDTQGPETDTDVGSDKDTDIDTGDTAKDSDTNVDSEMALDSDSVSDSESEDCGDMIWTGSVEVRSKADLEALRNYTRITGYLKVEESLDGFSTVDELKNIRCIDGSVEIEENGTLLSLNGLSELRRIGGSLTISKNSSLADLGLNNLKNIGGARLKIVQNGALPTCEATDLRDVLVSEGFMGTSCIQMNSKDTCEDDISGCSDE